MKYKTPTIYVWQAESGSDKREYPMWWCDAIIRAATRCGDGPKGCRVSWLLLLCAGLAGCASDPVVVRTRYEPPSGAALERYSSGNGNGKSALSTGSTLAQQTSPTPPAAVKAGNGNGKPADEPERPTSKLPPSQSATKAAAAPGELTIQPDCMVQVKVQEDPKLDGDYPVTEIGAIEFGYVGGVILYNLTEKGAAQKIEGVLEGRYFKDATVEVKIIRASWDKVQVSGAVNKPGTIRIGAGDQISLNDALLRAGGLKPSAKGAKVRIVRNGLLDAVAATLDGEEYLLVADDGKPTVPSVNLRNNDVVYIFSSDAEAMVEMGEKEVLVLGEVSKPGVYKFSGAEPCSIMHLVLKMGGLPAYADQKNVKVVRRDKEGGEEEFKVNAQRILEGGNPDDDFPLENGDRVLVPSRRLSLF